MLPGCSTLKERYYQISIESSQILYTQVLLLNNEFQYLIVKFHYWNWKKIGHFKNSKIDNLK